MSNHTTTWHDRSGLGMALSIVGSSPHGWVGWYEDKLRYVTNSPQSECVQLVTSGCRVPRMLHYSR